ncbi:MAG: NADH-quinone oxidoreductase subunit L [Solirubrobacteraceae bacterium]|nr:NADH-quinone oxidoreductase subunit L [Solirubrobacteraceae bacterium]
MKTAETFTWLALCLPLAGAIINGLGFKVFAGKTAGIIGTFFLFASFACVVVATISLKDLPGDAQQHTSVAWTYAKTLGVDAELSLLIDPLAMYMALVVTGVSSLIHLYSVGYMKSDEGYVRFFSYLNFFVFSMLVLVLAGNFLILIVGWAFVGAASYMLISYWYRRTTATNAGIKAFVINVLGDVGLVLGTYFIFKGTGSLDFLTTFKEIEEGAAFASTNDGDLVAGCLLLLVGAFAKSAQVPLHTWLPDAMEGPTPVSSLIHAATMVTAGVYLIARMWPLFEQAPAAANVGAIIGCLTLFIAATIALTQTDLKRVIAYSTMSQIGYMVMAVCSGAYVAGLFHLMTHAFFKALLFMAAGSVIAAMANVQNLDKMGGFRKPMPFTYGCFIVGGLALSGIPPFSGFFSKDEILTYTADRGGFHVALAVIGYIAAFMTAVYTFRLIFRAFWGEPVEEAKELAAGHLAHGEHVNPANGEPEDTQVGFPGPEHHIAERSPEMKIAMGVLAFLATVSGALQIPTVTHWVDTFLEPTFEESHYFHSLHPSDSLTFGGMALGATLGVLGIALAYFIWIKRPGMSLSLIDRFRPLYSLSFHKWWFDEAIDFLIVRPGAWTGRFFNQQVERIVINGVLTGGTTGLVKSASAAVRGVQSGLMRYYAAAFAVGTIAVTFYFLANS